MRKYIKLSSIKLNRYFSTEKSAFNEYLELTPYQKEKNREINSLWNRFRPFNAEIKDIPNLPRDHLIATVEELLLDRKELLNHQQSGVEFDFSNKAEWLMKEKNENVIMLNYTAPNHGENLYLVKITKTPFTMEIKNDVFLSVGKKPTNFNQVLIVLILSTPLIMFNYKVLFPEKATPKIND